MKISIEGIDDVINELEKLKENMVADYANNREYQITCPECGYSYSAKPGINDCPNCGHKVELVLDIKTKD